MRKDQLWRHFDAFESTNVYFEVISQTHIVLSALEACSTPTP